MATCNIEGIRSNVALAQSLLKTYDIVFFQEHWLFGFEQNYLQDLCDNNNTDCIIRSIDDGDPITLHQRPRGYGGIAVAYNNNLAKHIQPLPDGNTAIQPIILNSVPRGICITNAAVYVSLMF